MRINTTMKIGLLALGANIAMYVSRHTEIQLVVTIVGTGLAFVILGGVQEIIEVLRER